MWKRVAILFANLSLVSPASATGGFTCIIADENIQFETSGALGRSSGSPILNLTAHANTKVKGTPNDLQELDLKSSLVHSWINFPELKLHFYLEREGETPHGTYDLILEMKATGDEISYEGDYRLNIFYTEPPADETLGAYLKASGKVRCEGE